MAIVLSTFNELLFPGIKEVFGDDYREKAEQYSRYFDLEMSNKTWEEYQEISGFGLVPVKNERSNTQLEDAYQGIKTTLTNVAYSLGYEISHEMLQDDQYQKMMKLPGKLAKSVRVTVETLGGNILNNGFSTSYLGADGKPLFATDHPLPANGSFSNRPTVAADLSETSFEQALIDIRAFVDQRNLPIEATPKLLIVHPSDDYTASKLLESGQEPETANNAINPAKGRMPYMVSDYVTDTDAWFIRTDVDGLLCQKREWPADLQSDINTLNRSAIITTYFRLVFGWYDPRSIYGNPGV
jgi:phage major head subunit gpT-like protein